MNVSILYIHCHRSCFANGKNKTITPVFEAIIHNIRGQKVILDYDLAKLYGVETRIINRAVKRNIERFPPDGMFQLNEIEWESLRSQIGILDAARGQYTKYFPFAFTELGIAMLSSVLRSDIAIQVNLAIMRTFIELRDHFRQGRDLGSELSDLKQNTNQLFKIVFERLDTIEKDDPIRSPDRRKIGIKT